MQTATDRKNYRGRLNGTKGKYEPSVELLAKKTTIDPATGCHLWTGVANHNGYGRIGINYRDYLVHRVAYELHHGKIPEGLFVCHKCDVRLCINPEHLFLGTLQDNHADMCKKKRNTHGQSQWLAKLNPEAVREIRSSALPNETLARKFGVTRGAIDLVRKGETWRHVA